MPFTQTDKVQIKSYLGYAEVDDLSRKGSSIQYLNQVLDRQDLSDEYVGFIRSLLTRLAAIDLGLAESSNKSLFKRIDVIEYNAGSGYKNFLSEGSRLIYQLASNLGVSVRRNPFDQQSLISIRSY